MAPLKAKAPKVEFDAAAPKAKAIEHGLAEAPPAIKKLTSEPFQPEPLAKRLFQILRRGGFSPAEKIISLRKLFPTLPEDLEKVLRKLGRSARDYDFETPKMFADAILEHLSVFGVKAKTLADFRRSIRGY